MPIYKMDGKKDGLQKYRVRINYADREGKHKQLDRVAYGKEAARDLERKLNIELRSGELTTNRMTLHQLYDEYLKVKSTEIREVTVNRNKKRIELYILPSLGDYKLSALTLPLLQKWKLEIEAHRTAKGTPLALYTKQGIYSVFRALLNYAVKMEYLQKNPITTLGNFKDPYGTQNEMNYFTAEEFIKFISAARSEAEKTTSNIYEWNFYTFFMLAFYTGARKGEINALRWSDIDKDILHIRRSISQKLRGKDRETPPKNKSSIRDIQIPSPLKNALTEHLRRCQSIAGFSNDWHICGGENCLRDTTIQHRFERYANKANIKHIRIHDFRHSHASLLANNGINIQEIARRLGHSDVQTTWKVYAHLYPREEERAISVLNTVKPS